MQNLDSKNISHLPLSVGAIVVAFFFLLTCLKSVVIGETITLVVSSRCMFLHSLLCELSSIVVLHLIGNLNRDIKNY